MGSEIRPATVHDWRFIERMQTNRLEQIANTRALAGKPALPKSGIWGLDEAVWLVFETDRVRAAGGYQDTGSGRNLALLWDETNAGKVGAARIASVVFTFSDESGIEVCFWAHPEPSPGFVALIERCGFSETSREYRRPIGGGSHVRINQ